ncbi:MAG: hypothetical protein PVI90_00120 [Desulfobacteraceae bacterium]
MGYLLAVTAITIVASYATNWADQYTTIRLKNTVLFSSEGTLAFWRAQLGEVGRYRFCGMPKEAVLIARLFSIVNDVLVLHDANDREIARIPFGDVDEYYVGLPPSEEVDMN